MQTVKSGPRSDDSDQQQLSKQDDSGGDASTGEQQSGQGDNEEMPPNDDDTSAQAVSVPDNDEEGGTPPEDSPIMSGTLDEKELEDALAEDLLLRRILDKPKVVLRARLRMALKKQETEFSR